MKQFLLKCTWGNFQHSEMVLEANTVAEAIDIAKEILSEYGDKLRTATLYIQVTPNLADIISHRLENL